MIFSAVSLAAATVPTVSGKSIGSAFAASNRTCSSIQASSSRTLTGLNVAGGPPRARHEFFVARPEAPRLVLRREPRQEDRVPGRDRALAEELLGVLRQRQEL